MVHLQQILPLALAAASGTTAQPTEGAAQGQQYEAGLALRALPDSPSGNYTPLAVDCPSTKPSVRLADKLSDQERSWVSRRRNNTVDPLRDLLKRANIPDFDADSFMDSARNNATALPNIGIAVSGGGYRALMNGAGFVSAADSRNSKDGAISGLLQSSTYLAGLSGGGWLVGSIFANNFSTVPDLQKGNDKNALWKFNQNIFLGPDKSGDGPLNPIEYWGDIRDQVQGKRDKGLDTSVTDYWGRALSYQLVGAPDGGPAYTFSSIMDTDNFKDGQTPFPILIADGRAPGEKVISLNATVYEFNPYEVGSWDPTTFGFAPLRYMGSNFSNGAISNNGKCVRGYDQIGFVMGTSSSLFNQFLLQNVTQKGEEFGLSEALIKVVEKLLLDLSTGENDIAQVEPNPFLDWNPTSKSVVADDDVLSLVDGGEDLQNIPLHPLIQPSRGVDVIFAVDSSADTTYSWPNGTALRATYDRSVTTIANGTLFPPIPSAETFINLGLNRRPTLFGCDAANFTLSPGQSVPPLVMYIPNAPYSTLSNVSTFDPQYTLPERDAIIRNGLNAATQGNATVDADWPRCVACAILSRSWSKAGQQAPEACRTCFDRYCWDGKTNDTAIQGEYEPAFISKADFNVSNNSGGGNKDDDSGAARMGAGTIGVVAWTVGVAWALGLL